MAKIFKFALRPVLLCATLLVVIQAQEKVDVTGTWVFQVETSGGAGSPTFTFKQEGEKLTGKYSGQFGEADIKGTMKGNQIDFSFNAEGLGVITYSGTFENGAMKGKVNLGDQASGTWTAKRKE